jgi:hypothetical protein
VRGEQHSPLSSSKQRMKKYTIAGLLAAALVSSPALALDVSASNATDVSVNAELKTKTEAKATTSSSANGSASSEASGGVSVIVFTRADIEGSGNGENISPASVQSNTDLSGYVAAQIASDENISEVETSPNSVSVTYMQRADLFGFIPMNVEATAIVRADGSIEVNYPWYAFMMLTNENELEAELQAAVAGSSSIAASADAAADVGFSAATQSELIREVRSVMAASLSADLATEMTATANAGTE